MRTFVQLDVQNLFFSAKDKQKRIDFLKIKEYFDKSGDDIIGMYAYIIRTPDAQSDKFEQFLKNLKYKLIIKKAYKHVDYYNKGGGGVTYTGTDQDMAICIDCMRMINKFDKWVLMSGDGDFIDLCKYLKDHGKTVDVWSVKGSSFNKRFCNYVDTIHFLNDDFFYDHSNDHSSK